MIRVDRRSIAIGLRVGDIALGLDAIDIAPAGSETLSLEPAHEAGLRDVLGARIVAFHQGAARRPEKVEWLLCRCIGLGAGRPRFREPE